MSNLSLAMITPARTGGGRVGDPVAHQQSHQAGKQMEPLEMLVIDRPEQFIGVGDREAGLA